jgi:tRNA A58 N-methylase Trm61
MTSPSDRLLRATELAHTLIRDRIAPAGMAIDATVGNGHDTAFLLECVGPTGKVYGFDIQPQAIEKTRSRVGESPALVLHCAGHEQISEFVRAPVDAVAFNLGYLPSGDKTVITRADTTIRALESCLDLLSDNGIITVVVYPGHEGGEAEAEALLGWSRQLDQESWTVIHYGFLNQRNAPPFLLAIERRPQ